MGVDVAKDKVDVARFGESTVLTLDNNKVALSKWLSTLPANCHLAVESTGSYHELLAELAYTRGFVVYVLNPKDVRHYAQSVGRRGKTDRMDALLLARYLAREHSDLHPWTPPSPAQRQLSQLLKRRVKLVEAKGAIRSSMAGLPMLANPTANVLREIEQMIDHIDREIQAQVHALPQGKETLKRLCSIPGIGLLNGAALTGLMQRLDFANHDAVVAFVGLDPRPADSGNKRGQRRLTKRGPAELRRLLYNAAMAARKSAYWKPYYERQLAKGLAATQALIVLARKLVRLAYALFKHKTSFDPGHNLAT